MSNLVITEQAGLLALTGALGWADVRAYGAVGDGVTDDTAAIQAAINTTKNVRFPKETYLITSELTVTTDGQILHFDNATLTTASNITMLRFGASAASNSVYKYMGTSGTLTIQGAGNGNAANYGLVVRNVSYGGFNAITKITNCGAKAFVVQAYARGNQHTTFGPMEIQGNHAGAFLIDAGSQAGGYLNDNVFMAIRAHENRESGGTITHAQFLGTGTTIGNNKFYGVAIETDNDADTLLDIDLGSSNYFYGLRLDGTASTTALDIASGCNANMFFGWSLSGVVIDASNTSLIIADSGSGDYPYIQFGSALAGANAWQIGIQKPGTPNELHISYLDAADGIVRFPNNTEVFFGNRDGGDNAPIEIIGEDKRIDLRTLGSTAIGSGSEIRFDGRYSSSGDNGVVTVKQIGNVAIGLEGHFWPNTDNTYYLGKNDDDTPFAWKGVILKDTTNGKYYRIEVINGTITATDLTD